MSKPAAATHRQVRITRAQLPLCCPRPDERLWDGHPRVYLPIEDNGGEIHCPYCGTHYIVTN